MPRQLSPPKSVLDGSFHFASFGVTSHAIVVLCLSPRFPPVLDEHAPWRLWEWDTDSLTSWRGAFHEAMRLHVRLRHTTFAVDGHRHRHRHHHRGRGCTNPEAFGRSHNQKCNQPRNPASFPEVCSVRSFSYWSVYLGVHMITIIYARTVAGAPSLSPLPYPRCGPRCLPRWLMLLSPVFAG